MSKEFPEIDEVQKVNKAIEAMKLSFEKAKGSSLGDLRRAAGGVKESPAAMTEAEKEMAAASAPAKEDWLPEGTRVPQLVRKARVRRVVGAPIMKNKAELIIEAKQKLENAGALESPKPKERAEIIEAWLEDAIPTKEQIPMAKANKIPGIEIPKEVAQTKKKSKSFWDRVSALGKWLVS